MQTGLEATVLLLKETASYLRSAHEEFYAKDIKNIEDMIERLQNERLETVILPRLISHLIMQAKPK